MIPESRIRTLIFDYDGVIANTEEMHWRSWVEILEPLGVRFTWDQYCQFGRGIQDAGMLDKLRQLAQNPSALSGLEEQDALRKRIMLERCISEPPIPESTIEMLHSLKGYRLGLVTSSANFHVQPVLRAAGIDHCFDAMVFGEDVELHKPAPDPYLLLGRRLGVNTGLVFEDSDAGMASALAAGFTVIPVPEPEQLSGIVYREMSRS